MGRGQQLGPLAVVRASLLLGAVGRRRAAALAAAGGHRGAQVVAVWREAWQGKGAQLWDSQQSDAKTAGGEAVRRAQHKRGAAWVPRDADPRGPPRELGVAAQRSGDVGEVQRALGVVPARSACVWGVGGR